jgi:hypothetical protein
MTFREEMAKKYPWLYEKGVEDAEEVEGYKRGYKDGKEERGE